MRESLVQIAVIDDGINEKRYDTVGELRHNVEITTDLTICERSGYDARLDSHGTTCAAIIKRYAGDAVLSSIKILNGQTQSCFKEQLIEAISWCIDENIKIVHLSLGTTYYKDFADITPVVELACSKGIIIVAACSNRNIYTCPASLAHVIGVKADEKKQVRESEFIYHSFHPDGIEITACSSHLLKSHAGEQKVTQISNSYAAPVITAFAYQILCTNMDATTDDIKAILETRSLIKGPEDHIIRSSFSLSEAAFHIKAWMP